MSEHLEIWNEQIDIAQTLAMTDVIAAEMARERKAGPRQ